MKLDASYLHFISQQQLRVLTAIQLGMRNHQWVPVEVISKLSRLRGGESYKILRKLLKNKFVVHTGKRYDGYKLSYLGYDYLALQTFIKRGILKDVICKIGVGKQSDIYKCITPQGQHVVLKLTRLGRNSFRSVKKNREYIQHRTNYNWLYLSRLSSIREFLFMQLLFQNNFETPKPIDTNRHAIVMSLIDGEPLCHIQRINTQEEIKSLFETAREMLIQFAQNGLIHGDYNEFNLITNEQGTKLTVIDFPQCISINHPNAQEYFNRDVECIYKYFDKMVERQLSQKQQANQQQQGDMQKHKKQKFILNVSDYPMPVLGEIEVIRRLDREIKSKGHITLTEEKQLEQVLKFEKENRNQQDKQYNKELESQDDDEQQSDEQVGSSQQSKDQGQVNQQNKQLKKMSFDLPEGEQLQQIQNIHEVPHKSQQKQQIYDNELELLMQQLNHTNLRSSQQNDQSEQSQQQQPQRPQFKGLTAYQVRLKIKQQKKQQRQKRNKQMTEDEFIKNVVKRSVNNKKFTNNSKGNKGMKRKTKMNSMAIKQGYQM